MEIRWLAGGVASGFYATGQMLRGCRFVNEELAAKLAQPVDEFRVACETWQVVPIELADHLTAASTEATSIESLTRTAIRKVAGTAAVDRVAAAILPNVQQIQSLFATMHPRLMDDLELRSVPLREQWEARGPGLISGLKRVIGPELLVERADVVLVHPVLGGGGVAHVPYNAVSFEAVLANPVAELPEIVRLAWLLAQLQLDLPSIHGNLSRDRTLLLGQLALLPATLVIAHDIETAGPLETSLHTAFAAWNVPMVDQITLLAWWETYLAERPVWPAALAALDQLLREPQAPPVSSEF